MKRNTQGFTMVELLVVLLVVGILAAVAVPAYLANTQRARASEAVAAMSQIRQSLRDWQTGHGAYFTVTVGNINQPLPTSVVANAPTPATAGVDVNAGVAQYFSNRAYTVNAAAGVVWAGITAANAGNPGNPVDFLISTNGANSEACVAGDADCAIHNADVANYRLQMDNSGRIFVSYDAGANWSAW